MKRHHLLIVLIGVIILLLAVLLLVGVLRGGDAGEDLEPNEVTPSPTSSAPSG